MKMKWLLVAVIVFITALALAIIKRSGDDEIVRRPVSGDVTGELRGIEAQELPVHARAYLASDRPWRAAHIMRRYINETADVSDDMRVLAARAEAGWGGWPRVRDLLEKVDALDTYEHGIGLYLLGRGYEAAGDAAKAVESFRAYLALPTAVT